MADKLNFEIETKVLDIDPISVLNLLETLGANKLQETRLVVDWFRPKGIVEGEDPWFLRIRSNSAGENEVTWKAKSQINGTTRQHKEINFMITEPAQLTGLFEELGLELYAHQEKDRISFSFHDWRFDLDQYPGMPAYLEIEGGSEEHVKEAMKLFGLENNRTWAEGERKLIQGTYGLNWYDMKF